MTGTFVYIKKDYSQNFFKNGWKMRCLWPSKNQRNWTFDMIYWALRHNQNHSNWNLANILAWKTSFIIGLSYFIHLWKSFCLKLALNLSDPQAPHFTTIFEKFLQTIIFYVNKNASYILVTICEPSRILHHPNFHISTITAVALARSQKLCLLFCIFFKST